MKLARLLLPLVAVGSAVAHPMGNFSANHYAHFVARVNGVELTYALDLAEVPSFELLKAWNVDVEDRVAIVAALNAHAPEWLKALRIRVNGKPAALRFEKADSVVTTGAGGLPVMRLVIAASLPVSSGAISYEDTNYIGQPGWKEIVVTAREGVPLVRSNAPTGDRSHVLTAYPSDAVRHAPQDVRASFVLGSGVDTAAANVPAEAAPDSSAIPTKPAPAAGDYLSRMLHGGTITAGVLLAGLCVAFGLGALHAMSPGHGKTIVAAYLVGTRGTLKHALFLGAMVTFTHTISVFILGLGVLFFQQYVAPEKAIPILGAISGLSIVAIGAMLLYQRMSRLTESGHQRHDRAHPHNHRDDHHHHHHDHDHAHPHVHLHGARPHTHVPEGKLSLAGLIALGAGGGLVPCPSALVLLLSAIALGRTGLGLILLTAFSAGLALVLMTIGALVLYARNLLPETGRFTGPFFRYVPVFSAVVVIVLGLVMTGVSIGWIQPGRILG